MGRKNKKSSSTPEDPRDEFFALYRDASIDIAAVDTTEMEMEFDIIGVVPSIANAVRRALLVEVPSMAPETVYLVQNQSAIPDEVLGHRIGLIPFKADPRKFKFRPPNTQLDHPDYALIFEMNVQAPKQNLKTDKRFLSTRIYTKDFKWIRNHPSQKEITDDSHLRPVYDDIILNVLRPGQAMEFKVHVVKGIGKDHTKFSPVSVATYRLHPVINLLRPVYDDEAEELKACFSPGVIRVKEKNGTKEAYVVNARIDSNSRNILRESKLKKAVEIGSKSDHFIFSVESIGAMKAAVLVKEALKILKNRCEYHYLSIGYQHREMVEIVEDYKE